MFKQSLKRFDVSMKKTPFLVVFCKIVFILLAFLPPSGDNNCTCASQFICYKLVTMVRRKAGEDSWHLPQL